MPDPDFEMCAISDKLSPNPPSSITPIVSIWLDSSTAAQNIPLRLSNPKEGKNECGACIP
jgi:hypothetical protein